MYFLGLLIKTFYLYFVTFFFFSLSFLFYSTFTISSFFFLLRINEFFYNLIHRKMTFNTKASISLNAMVRLRQKGRSEREQHPINTKVMMVCLREIFPTWIFSVFGKFLKAHNISMKIKAIVQSWKRSRIFFK